jgi:hypothetical protein
MDEPKQDWGWYDHLETLYGGYIDDIEDMGYAVRVLLYKLHIIK